MPIETLTPPAQGKKLPDLTKAPPITPTHNQTLPDHDKIVVIAGKFDEFEKEKQALAARGKRLRQIATNQGIGLAILERVRKDLAVDPETVLAREEAYRHYMMAFDSPLGTQLALFPMETAKRTFSQKELLDKAFARGKTLGLLGKDADTQAYPLHTDLGQEHERGWQAGQRVNLDYFEAINQDVDEAEAEAARKKEEKALAAKKKAQEKADARRDAAAKKLAAKEQKAAVKKAEKDAAAAKKKAAADAKAKEKAEADPKIARPKFGKKK